MWATMEGEQVPLGIGHTRLPGHLSPRALLLCLSQVCMQSTAGTYEPDEDLAEVLAHTWAIWGKWVYWSVVR
jgi:hypothetical protein